MGRVAPQRLAPTNCIARARSSLATFCGSICTRIAGFCISASPSPGDAIMGCSSRGSLRVRRPAERIARYAGNYVVQPAAVLSSGVFEHDRHRNVACPPTGGAKRRGRDRREQAAQGALVDALILGGDSLDVPCATELERHADAPSSIELGFEPTRKTMMNRRTQASDDQVSADPLRSVRGVAAASGNAASIPPAALDASPGVVAEGAAAHSARLRLCQCASAPFASPEPSRPNQRARRRRSALISPNTPSNANADPEREPGFTEQPALEVDSGALPSDAVGGMAPLEVPSPMPKVGLPAESWLTPRPP